MKKRSFIDRLNDAIEGLITIFKEQRNMKLHLLVAILILGTAVFVGLGRLEIIILILAMGLILFAEMINSYLEKILDFIHPDYHPMLRIIKNALAGTVLFTGIVAFSIVYFLFNPYLESPLRNGFQRLKGAHWYVTFFTLLTVIALVILMKAFFHKGKPLRGGVPSGHAALSFSIWAMVTFLENNPLLSALVFLLALMISGSRLKEGIHNIWEIILGAVLGFTVTLIIFQIFT